MFFFTSVSGSVLSMFFPIPALLPPGATLTVPKLPVAFFAGLSLVATMLCFLFLATAIFLILLPLSLKDALERKRNRKVSIHKGTNKISKIVGIRL